MMRLMASWGQRDGFWKIDGREAITVKGFAKPVRTFRLTGRGPDFLKFGCRNIRYTLEAVEAYESSHFENSTVSSV
jgi:hypothetical protein